MTPTPVWLLALQVLANVAVVATFGVYWYQLRTMQNQLIVFRDGSRTENLLTLIQYIQQADLAAARKNLFALKGKDFASWSSQERLDAERACSGWDVVGLMVKAGSIAEAKELVVGTWGYSIVKCYMIATPLIVELQRERGATYWDDFVWLASQAKVSSGGRQAGVELDAAA